MIFRSRRQRNESADTATLNGERDEQPDVDPEDGQQLVDHDQVADESTGPESPEAPAGQADQVASVDPTGAAEAIDPIDLADLDNQEWRDLGPYDIAEVDAEALEEPDAEQPRIDLGSMVLAASDGMELRLQVDENSQQIVSAMMIRDDSALEVGAFAAPRSGGLWAEIRDELIESAESAGGSANLVPGPFGVELRRLLPVRTPDGQEGYQPSRMWVAEGPRWMLRGIIYGQAALEDGLETPVAEILESFRQIVVRRGDEAMAPGDLLPLSLPENMSQGEPVEEQGEPVDESADPQTQSGEEQ
ncbi:DUF3710 domain-containing protein [Microlunatus elymi]|uniref:DUF3710 domain-containing protein n=1 Tax=Microlunatus elymi TaxID=2596828 RepID=A0A516PZM1_9ACTN|nr:DUF3710 domain-containing protein [Microlunatus elymi]QDP96592.1 DUF3710 domain-containing protein [Microlunatus elymi]